MTSYSDADYVICRVDKKSTNETYQFLRNCLVSWSFKKQNFVALSTAEVEYVTAGACYAQILWMKHTLLDYDLYYDHIKLFCDNASLIHITKNPNQHGKTKHIEIRYHFFRDNYEKRDIKIDYVSTDFHLADIFIKPLDFNRFSFICGELNICIIDSWVFIMLNLYLFLSFLIDSLFTLFDAWQKGEEVFVSYLFW